MTFLFDHDRVWGVANWVSHAFFSDAAPFLGRAPSLSVDITFCLDTETDTVDLRGKSAVLHELLALIDEVITANRKAQGSNFHPPEHFPIYNMQHLDRLRTTVQDVACLERASRGEGQFARRDEATVPVAAMDLSATVFVDSELSATELLDVLASVPGAKRDGYRVGRGPIEIGVLGNDDDRPPNARDAEQAFLFYRYRLEVHARGDASADVVIAAVDDLLETLWRIGADAVAAADYEDALPVRAR